MFQGPLCVGEGENSSFQNVQKLRGELATRSLPATPHRMLNPKVANEVWNLDPKTAFDK